MPDARIPLPHLAPSRSGLYDKKEVSMDELTVSDLDRAHIEYERRWPHFTRTLRVMRRTYGGDELAHEGTERLDVEPTDPCADLIYFLNRWWCHIPKSTPSNYECATTSFALWREEHYKLLPPKGRQLNDAHDVELWRKELLAELGKNSEASCVDAFDALRDSGVRDLPVRHYSDVATSKIFYVMRPHLFLAWDNPMRSERSHNRSGASYLGYVLLACEKLQRLMESSEKELRKLRSESGCTGLELINKHAWITSRPDKK